MKKNIPSIILLVSLGLIFINSSWFSESGINNKRDAANQQKKLRSIPNKAFSVGEKLTFDIDFQSVTVGSATLAIPRIKKYNGHDVYEVQSRVVSNKFISNFYKVDDNVVSYIDTAGIFSLRLEKHLREGNWSQDRLFFIDQEKNLAYSRRDTVSIPEFCQDILSAFYYVRTQDLQVGSTIEIPNYDNDKVYFLKVNVLKKQSIRVPAGKFDCIVVEPKLKTRGLFKHEGTIKIYLTDDEKKIPVLMTSKVTFGQIAAKLTKIETEILP